MFSSDFLRCWSHSLSGPKGPTYLEALTPVSEFCGGSDSGCGKPAGSYLPLRLDSTLAAKPSSNLYLKQNLMKEYQCKSMLCTASRFFPANISLHWKKKTVKDFQFQEFFANVTGDPIIRNHDGTFNVSRSLNLKMSLADNLTVFQCVIEHLASGTTQVLNLTLIIPGEKGEYCVWAGGPTTSLPGTLEEG